MTHIIDLQDHVVAGVRSLTSRPWGIAVRNASKIDILEPQFEKIIIRIPDTISTVNAAFLEEFLENVVMKMGEPAFRRKFSFKCPDHYDIDSHLDVAINRILKAVVAY